MKNINNQCFAYLPALLLLTLPASAADVGLTDDGGNQYSISSSAGDTLVIDSSSTYTETVDLTDSPFFTVPDASPYTVGDVISGTYGPYTFETLTRISSISGSFDINFSPIQSGTGGAAGVNLNLAKTVTLNAGGTTELGSISMTDSGNRVLDLSAGTLRLGTAGTIARSTTFSSSDPGGLLISGGILTAGGADNTAGSITLNAPGDSAGPTQRIASIIIESQITDNGSGAVSLIKGSAGNQTVKIDNASNSYSGGTTVEDGRLWVGAAGSLGTGDVTVQNGAQIAFNDGGSHSNNISIIGIGPEMNFGSTTASYQNIFAGALVLTEGTTLSGNITLTGNARISTSQIIENTESKTGSISGDITGAFDLEIGSTEASNAHGGTLTLSGTGNDWTGDTYISNRATSGSAVRTVVLDASQVLPNGIGRGDLYIKTTGNDNNRTRLSLNGNNETINGLNSLANSRLSKTRTVMNNSSSAASTLTIGDADADGDYDGNIIDGSSQSLGITKIGSGTQILFADATGALSYSGATTVNGGTLIINSELANSAVTVNSGGTLGGIGSFGGGVTIASGGTLAPGNSPGLQSVNDANLSLNSGATFSWELTSDTDTTRGTDFDAVDVTGTGVLNIDSGVSSELVFNISGSTVDFTSAFWDSDQSWHVFDLDNSPTLGSVAIFDSITSSQDSLGNAFTVTGGALSWSQSGDDVYLDYAVAIPEPSSLLLIGMAIGTVLVFKRRKSIR